ncbi:MAG TPA: alpha/beta hydrolase [Thauera sp.]|uniref:alpha/beta fold hydrolase n=1 Tax=Thauera sp. TaxID=1905334 RepID=UPI002B6D64BB|nr:alpha/beta hydrolase [Thauera sp.]HRP25800.1 alpha/beta hydrolase [Thauera sp.]HRP66583.1 alpha/beta hydrolase [Thauera sp.]
MSSFGSLFETPPSPQRPRHGVRERSVQCLGPHGLHRMAYTEWGDPRNPRVLVCVHGLTRNGRDFDDLAQALADDYRVVCPDVVGRGRSDWLGVKADYGFPVYVADMVTLIARLDVEQVHWVGTSMGGIIGMLLASQPHSPITRLVLNDVGPVITTTALQRIAQYVGMAPRFPSMEAAEAYIREVSASFGPLTDSQWRHLTQYSVRPVGGADGGFAMVYDPGLGDAFRASPILEDIDLWGVYDNVRCPTLALRGAESDLLTPDTFTAMAGRGPQAQLVEFAGVGHAPMLMDETQITVVRDFLLGGG